MKIEKRVNKNGYILIFILVWLALIVLGINILTKSLILRQAILLCDIGKARSLALAYSGLALAPDYWTIIPETPLLSQSQEKKWLVANLGEGLFITNQLDGEIFLFKSSDNYLYSIGINQDKYKTFLKTHVDIIDGKLLFFRNLIL